VRQFVGTLGRTLIAVGVLLLIFVVYQLWGTGIYAAREQSQLNDQFEQTLRASAGSPTAAPPPAPLGDAVGQIRIPKIGVDEIVVNGIGAKELRTGPGLYPDHPRPGQLGNAAIAGHRTTYGAPFSDLDQLQPGDEITVRTTQGAFAYQVRESLVVDPSNISVLSPRTSGATTKATLTLITCNPKFSAAERLVIFADLTTGQTPLAPNVSDRTSSGADNRAGISDSGGSGAPAVISGLIAAAIGGLWWWVLRRRRRRWYVWVGGAVPFLIAFLVFSFFVERMLPANY